VGILIQATIVSHGKLEISNFDEQRSDELLSNASVLAVAYDQEMGNRDIICE